MKQEMRFDKKQLELIKSTFADDHKLLKAIRKVMLQLELREEEDVLIRSTFHGGKNLMDIVRQVFLPEIDGDSPLGQVIDLWMTIDIKDKDPADAFVQINAREIVIDYIRQQIDTLSGENIKEPIVLKDLVKTEKDLANAVNLNIRFIARNTIIMHTEQQLNQLLMLAGRKDETSDETIKRLQENSNK